jgi:flagellar biosynthesis/type III secretory pathway protein FliH
MTKDIRPLLTSVASPTRPLGAALPRLATPEVTSPWTPRTAEAAAAAAIPAPTEDEIAEIYEDARERGRTDGLAETGALRDRLTTALAALATARAQIAAPAAELITEIASCVIEAWTANAAPGELFAPLVRSWAERSAGQPATARVHPDGAAALIEAIGDAPITVVADPALAAGAVEIRGATLELCHDWQARLPDLRTAIAGALTGAAS